MMGKEQIMYRRWEYEGRCRRDLLAMLLRKSFGKCPRMQREEARPDSANGSEHQVFDQTTVLPVMKLLPVY